MEPITTMGPYAAATSERSANSTAKDQHVANFLLHRLLANSECCQMLWIETAQAANLIGIWTPIPAFALADRKHLGSIPVLGAPLTSRAVGPTAPGSVSAWHRQRVIRSDFVSAIDTMRVLP
jgi:hypothetical protein